MTNAYHHGDLREAVLRRAAEIITDAGPDALSLRSLAADLGVSHTAPRHHFGDRKGVLTALATDGFTKLGELLGARRTSGASFVEQGVAYVQFALEHPAHFQIMFTPTLLDEGNDALAAARSATFNELRIGVDSVPDPRAKEDAAAAVVAAWGMAHGIATLALSGNLDASDLRSFIVAGDVADITRRSASLLYFNAPGAAATSQ